MDPYEALGITPSFDGDLRTVRNDLVKRYAESGATPDEERMKAINRAYEALSGHEPGSAVVVGATIPRPGSAAFTLDERRFVVHTAPRRALTASRRDSLAAAMLAAALAAAVLGWPGVALGAALVYLAARRR